MTIHSRSQPVLALIAVALICSALITAANAPAEVSTEVNASVGVNAGSGTRSLDPVTQDNPETDREAPPGLIAPQIFSQGAQMNALLYTANGPGPHPTVLLLHGFPGNEKNLDLAQALRRAGFNVLFFHYRGAWGSDGDYSLPGVLDDIVTAL
ncbi:MAG: hypothetical protein KDI31_14745, partial [Pseudomonadales bacterium]|nr:hypothetical protein [Pseudomonadales bacterium]